MSRGNQIRANVLLVLLCVGMFVFSRIELVREYSGLRLLHYSTAIVWCCEGLILLGMASLVIGRTTKQEAQDSHGLRASMTSVGVLVIFFSMVLQFDVWQTIGKYSMFYQLHPSQNISELHNK